MRTAVEIIDSLHVVDADTEVTICSEDNSTMHREVVRVEISDDKTRVWIVYAD